MRAALIPLFFLLAGIQLYAQVVPGRYIVELRGEPAAPYATHRGHRARATDSVFRARAAELRSQHDGIQPELERRGAVVLDRTHAVLNSVVVSIPDARASELAAIPGVLRVHPVRLYHPVLDHALPLHSVPDAWNQIGGMANAGLGIKIAIIDTGIDNQHPGFQDPSLPAASGYPQIGQEADRVYTNNKIIVVRSYGSTRGKTVTGQDDIGHGTGVAMTAAGVTNTGPFGTITGVAPKAYLGSYKVFPDPTSGASTDLIIKAMDDAVGDGMDVLNLSLGSAVAQRPQDDPLVAAVENAYSAGRIVVISTGNSGPDPNTIGSPGSSPDAISVGSMSNDRIFTGTLVIAGGAPIQAIPGDGPNSAAPVSANVFDLANLDPTGLGCSPAPAGSLQGSIALILRGTCTFQDKLNNAASGGAVAALIYAAPSSPNAINIAAGTATLPAAMVDYQTGAALKQQIAGGPVNATLDFSLKPLGVNPSRISDYSSLGPNSDGGIKPDMVAVGESISTAQPLSQSGGYVVESGTSFSSPMVAGAAALLKGARPGLTAAQYRSLLINSAAQFGAPASVAQTGSGFLNMLAALQTDLTAVPASLSFGTGGDTTSQTVTLTLTNVGTLPDTFSIAVASVSGSAAPAVSGNTVQIAPGQSQAVSVTFAGTGLTAGAYQGYLQIQGTQSAVISHIPYWYGMGSGVPAQITILDAPTSATALSRQVIVFRTTDAVGIPVVQAPDVSFSAGGGTVVRVDSIDTDIPGAYQATIRVGAKGTSDVIHFATGGVSKDVTIPVQ